MNYDDIELIYEEQDPAPAIVTAITRVASIVLSSIIGGLVEAGQTAITEAAKLLTLERLTAVLTEHMREMAGTWVSKTMIDASQSEWLGSLMHAIGLDMTDIGEVLNSSLDKGFLRFEEVFRESMNRAGFQNDAIAGIWKISFTEHKTGIQDSMLNSSRITSTSINNLNNMWNETARDNVNFQVLNTQRQEELNRAELRSIFQDSPERVKERARLSQMESLGATRSSNQETLQADLPKVVGTLGKWLDPLKEFLTDQLDTFTRSITHLLTAKIPVTPKSALLNGATAFGMAVGFGALAHGVAASCEVLNPLSEMGFNYVAAYLVDIANFAPISRATWGKYIKYGLDVPIDYYIQRELRPTIPDPITLQMMAVKPDITMGDFRQGMSYYGFSEDWIDAVQRTMFKEPRYFELSIMLEDAHAGLDWLYKKCRRAAYNQEDAEILVNGLLSKVLRPYLQEYRTQLQYIFGSGKITEAQFDAFLDPLMLRPEATQLLKKAAKFRYLNSYIDDSITVFTDMFDKDQLDEDDFETSLTALGLRDDKIQLILDRQIVKKSARVAKTEDREIKSLIRKQQNLTIKLYTLAYQQGRISSLELRRNLLAADIDVSLVDLTVRLEDEKILAAETRKEMRSVESETSKINSTYEKGYIDLYRKDLIDIETLEKYILGLGRDPEYVRAKIQTEQIRKIKPEKILTEE